MRKDSQLILNELRVPQFCTRNIYEQQRDGEFKSRRNHKALFVLNNRA